MRRVILIAVPCILLLGVVAMGLFSRFFGEREERFVIVPSSVSQQRVANLKLPSKGSEDASHLLAPPKGLPKVRPFNEDRDFRPDNSIEWVIDVEFENTPVLQRSRILEVFGEKWLSKNGKPMIYGWSPEDNHWTFVGAAGVPETYTKLAFGWWLFDPLSEGQFQITSAELQHCHDALLTCLRQFGTPRLRTNRTSEEAEEISEQIGQLVKECDQDVIVVLAAPEGGSFDGRKTWDVMLCLGLQWGDGDLFHWLNESDVGDDAFFSVETSTPPGYFLPELIAAGEVQVHDLIFAYPIPRSADPEGIFNSMMNAVRYAQKRLGGDVQDAEGKPLDEEIIREKTRSVIQRLKEAGFSPGDGSVLRVM
jgi:cell division protein ZipA